MIKFNIYLISNWPTGQMQQPTIIVVSRRLHALLRLNALPYLYHIPYDASPTTATVYNPH